MCHIYGQIDRQQFFTALQEEWPIASKWFPSGNEGEIKTKEKYLKELSGVFITLKCNTVPFNICVDTCKYTETYTYAQAQV